MQDALDADTLVVQSEEDHVGAMNAGPRSGAQIGSDCVGEGRTPDPVRMLKTVVFELKRTRGIVQRNEVRDFGEIHLGPT